MSKLKDGKLESYAFVTSDRNFVTSEEKKRKNEAVSKVILSVGLPNKILKTFVSNQKLLLKLDFSRSFAFNLASFFNRQNFILFSKKHFYF